MRLIGALWLQFVIVSSVAVADPSRPLPPDRDLHLTIREDISSTLPLGPSCAGDAARSLTCRAFVVTLENASPHTIRVSHGACNEPTIVIEQKNPLASGGWWPISQNKFKECKPFQWTNLRIMPGGQTEYTTRLISEHRSAEREAFAPGSHILRARSLLFGCIEATEGVDCLAPLQAAGACFECQEPGRPVSNEITVDAPSVQPPGPMKFTFDVTLGTSAPRNGTSNLMTAGCPTKDIGSSIDCVLFHYVIRNLTASAIRRFFSSSSGTVIAPEYRTAGTGWKPLPLVPKRGYGDGGVFMGEQPVLAGGLVLEGNFTLRSLGFDTTPLPAAGDFEVRFTFQATACFASPDASFCLIRPAMVDPVLSPEIPVRIP